MNVLVSFTWKSSVRQRWHAYLGVLQGVVNQTNGVIHTYDINTWDKQEGTDLSGGSYWFKRCTTYNVFNRPCGKGTQGSQTFEYKVNKHNIFWPVPNSAITANNKGQLRQNYGYDGYDESIKMWTNEDAVADEASTN